MLQSGGRSASDPALDQAGDGMWTFATSPASGSPMNPILHFLFSSFKCLQTKCFIWVEWRVLFTAAKVCSTKKKWLFSNNIIFHCFYSAARLNQTFALPYVLLWLTASITRNKLNPFLWYIITGVESYCRDVTPPLLLHLWNSSVLASLSVSLGEVTTLVVAWE